MIEKYEIIQKLRRHKRKLISKYIYYIIPINKYKL